jgi:hypothetical protein
MKKSITGAVALLAGAVIAHGQGQVSFGDFYSSNIGNYTTVTWGGNAVGGSAAHTGTQADTGVGSDWTVQLYGVAGTTATLAQVEASPAQLDGAAAGTPITATLAGVPAGYLGQWNSTSVADINNAPAGGPATLAVAAWYNNNGTVTSITAAQAAGFANGWSATGVVNSLGAAPNLPPQLPNFGGTINTVGNVGSVPEPSTIALGVMGASAFLMRLRKKA